MNTQEENRAKDQARAQLDSIIEMVTAVNSAQEKNDESEEENARLRIQEDALSVEVRTDWHCPGAEKDNKPTEYFVLLCTGGPACRIIGDLSEYCEPESARLEYQDWFTPWNDYPLTEDEEKAVLQYCREFYFGE